MGFTPCTTLRRATRGARNTGHAATSSICGGGRSPPARSDGGWPVPVYRYRCPGGHETEKYSQIIRDHISCECGRKAHRLSVYPITSKTFILPGNIGAPEGAAYLERAFELTLI